MWFNFPLLRAGLNYFWIAGAGSPGSLMPRSLLRRKQQQIPNLILYNTVRTETKHFRWLKKHRITPRHIIIFATPEVPLQRPLNMPEPTNQRRRALHSSETNDTKRTSWSSFSRTPLVATATVFGVLMLAFHVKADASELRGSGKPIFFDRVKEGPLGLTKTDLILFGAVFLLAFELLQFLVEGSGSKWTRVARLDEVSRGAKNIFEWIWHGVLFVLKDGLVRSWFLFEASIWITSERYA